MFENFNSQALRSFCVFVFAVFSLNICANAQVEISQAWLIAETGDTLRGKISGKIDHTIHEGGLRFKKEGSEEVILMHPFKHKAFGYGNTIYESLSLSTNSDEENVPYFARTAVKGELSLFEVVLPGAQRYYALRKNNQNVVGLGKKTYLGTLYNFVQDCENMPATLAKIRSKAVKYEINGLSKVVHEYNQCKNPENAQVIKTEKTNVTKVKTKTDERTGILFGLSAGIRRGIAPTLGDKFTRNLESFPSLQPYAGICAGLEWKKNHHLFFETAYARNHVYFTYETLDLAVKETFTVNTAFLTASYRYAFKTSFFVEGGAGMQLGLSGKYRRDDKALVINRPDPPITSDYKYSSSLVFVSLGKRFSFSERVGMSVKWRNELNLGGNYIQFGSFQTGIFVTFELKGL